ncbi:MAG: protein kinase [Phycisphaerae bacterium]|nr:protein kinase [Phycisphaerae bacterium]
MAVLKSGDRINNYLLEEVRGTGSFAQVWSARHHTLEKRVAIKVLTDPQYVRAFRQEGVVVHGLRHPNIVRVEDIDAYDDPPYLIMELVDGPSLRQVIDAHPQGLPVGVCEIVLRGVCKALVAAHEAGLIHRDIKPANILLNHPADQIGGLPEHAVKVGDFGLGRASTVTTASIMQSGSLQTDEGRSIAGTLAYMSPEQREGKSIDPRSDLYACGIVLFEMLTGSRPAGIEMPSEIRPDVPPRLDDVFRRCYTRLEHRFPSAKAVLDALREPGRRAAGSDKTAVAMCPACHGQVDGRDQFCIHCGHQLVDTVPRCRACHAFVNASDRYCIFCGSRLGTGGD